MANITTANRIAYELDSIASAPADVDGLSVLQHFDYPESLSWNGNSSFLDSGAKFGKGCAYFPDTESNITITNKTRMFTLSPLGNYEAECFIKLDSVTAEGGEDAPHGNILDFGGELILSHSGTILMLTSSTWDIDKTSQATITAEEWHHILLRITGEEVYVYLDGAEALRAPIYGNLEDITPEVMTLGGYVGYMDEFAFRRNAGTGAPAVPEYPYETNVVTKQVVRSAPVTRASWSCANLPEGLTLSSSGQLTGHPTTAGTYDCDVTVATNWGTDTKTIKIVVQ